MDDNQNNSNGPQDDSLGQEHLTTTATASTIGNETDAHPSFDSIFSMAILSAALGLSPEIDRMTTQSRSELEVEKAKGWGRQEGCMDAERVTSTVSSQTFNSTLRSSLGFDPAKHSWLDKKEQLKSEYAKSQFSRISIPGPCGTSSYADMKDRAERGFHSGAVEGLSSRLDALAVSEGPSAPPRSAPEFELQNTEDDTMRCTVTL